MPILFCMYEQNNDIKNIFSQGKFYTILDAYVCLSHAFIFLCLLYDTHNFCYKNNKMSCRQGHRIIYACTDMYV